MRVTPASHKSLCNMPKLQTGTAEQDARVSASEALFSLPGRYWIPYENDLNSKRQHWICYSLLSCACGYQARTRPSFDPWQLWNGDQPGDGAIYRFEDCSGFPFHCGEMKLTLAQRSWHEGNRSATLIKCRWNRDLKSITFYYKWETFINCLQRCICNTIF